jgi:ribose 5-phosphate isomerase B
MRKQKPNLALIKNIILAARRAVGGRAAIHSMSKIYIGADHGGFELKNKIAEWLKTQNYEVEDCGAYTLDPLDDYPDFGFAVSDKVSQDAASKGIVICRSSFGVIIAANKVKKIRAASVLTPEMAKKGREHDDINVLGIAADWMEEEQIKQTILKFLETPFSPEEKRIRRIKKIEEREGI